jgi:putative endonuclease
VEEEALLRPSPDPRQQLGLDGEALAERELRRAGLRILERRYRTRHGEIDIVAEDGDILVFVEVKTRTRTVHGAPSAAVTPRKRGRIARVAAAFLQSAGLAERPCRFDVVEVLPAPSGGTTIRHIADAFRLWSTG